jgi:hypothetical protein
VGVSFRDMWNDLIDDTPCLPPPLAQTLINRAFADIRDYRLWSWLVPTGYITTPQNITTGTITTTLGSNLVTPDATAAAALNAVALANPPLANAQIGIGRQIRLSSQTSGTPGPLYSITAYDNSIPQITLDRVYAENSGAGLTYMCYKAYYQAPPSDGTGTPDFLRYFTVTNPGSGYTIRRRKLYYTQAQLNGIDPQRGATGDAYIIASYLDDPATGNVVHEWYPHPVNLRVYSCIYQKRGLPLSDTNPPPLTLPSELIMERAYMRASKWALKMVAVYPELQQTNWVMTYNMHKQDFKEQLIQAIKQDDEISPLVAFQQGGTFDFPLGGQFLQNHDVSSLVGGLD